MKNFSILQAESSLSVNCQDEIEICFKIEIEICFKIGIEICFKMYYFLRPEKNGA